MLVKQAAAAIYQGRNLFISAHQSLLTSLACLRKRFLRLGASFDRNTTVEKKHCYR